MIILDSNKYYNLGSVSMTSDINGTVSQYIEYIPFGEEMYSAHRNTYNSPYRYTAKELEEETGLYYYGARYYNPKLSIWLSVDPMVEKYISLSPYNYVMNNPIKYIDPDGRESIDTSSYGIFKDIISVIPKSKFIGWGHPGVKRNCFHYAWKQIKDVGYTMKSLNWGTSKKMNKDIFQIFLAEDVAGMKAGVQKDQFNDGVEYLIKSIENGVPVVVGVDDQSGSTNTDRTTDHFITIVGIGNDSKGNYFTFYDNATGNSTEGTSTYNKLYIDEKNMKIIGTADNGYARDTEYKEYTVTQIRKSKIIN